jgi:hypothetical protein
VLEETVERSKESLFPVDRGTGFIHAPNLSTMGAGSRWPRDFLSRWSRRGVDTVAPRSLESRL